MSINKANEAVHRLFHKRRGQLYIREIARSDGSHHSTSQVFLSRHFLRINMISFYRKVDLRNIWECQFFPQTGLFRVLFCLKYSNLNGFSSKTLHRQQCSEFNWGLSGAAHPGKVENINKDPNHRDLTVTLITDTSGVTNDPSAFGKVVTEDLWCRG